MISGAKVVNLISYKQSSKNEGAQNSMRPIAVIWFEILFLVTIALSLVKSALSDRNPNNSDSDFDWYIRAKIGARIANLTKAEPAGSFVSNRDRLTTCCLISLKWPSGSFSIYYHRGTANRNSALVFSSFATLAEGERVRRSAKKHILLSMIGN